MSKETKPRSRKENIVVQEVDGEILIYDLDKNRAVCLNHTSALVWQACDGKRTVAEINGMLGKQLQTQTDEDIVWLALDQLSKEKLIYPPLGLGTKYENMSRRDVVKKIGIGSAVALPIVAGLVAPPAVLAESACGTACVCDSTNVSMAGDICTAAVACPATPAACGVCRATAMGSNQPGMCFTA